MPLWRCALFVTAIGLLIQTGDGAGAADAPARGGDTSPRVVTDMAGRAVTLPRRIERVVTLGSLPVLHSFVFTMGEGRTIVNGLADFGKSPHWKYQTVFAPHLAGQPAMQQPNRDPNLEAILLAKPDAVLTMHRASVDLLRPTGIPAVFLAWREPEDVKACIALLGDVFRKPEVAARYRRYFDDTLARVSAGLGGVAPSARPTVLYFHPETLTQPRLIAEWWIPAAGGVSVTSDGRTAESRTFSLEQALLWDPEILIVTGPKDVETVKTDPRFKQLRAVRQGRIYVVPVGAHTWANRTAEQPLTVLWAAKTFHPERFAAVSMPAEVKAFYREFFGHALTDAQVAEMLSGAL
jgi:iron complex transport system substrate-binding protein